MQQNLPMPMLISFTFLGKYDKLKSDNEHTAVNQISRQLTFQSFNRGFYVESYTFIVCKQFR